MSRNIADVVLGGSKRRFTGLTLASLLAITSWGLHGTALAADPTTVIASMPGAEKGAQPYGAMVQAPDGYVYGTALTNSPDSGWGLVFRVKTNGSGYKVVHAFDGSTEGGSPRGDLMVGSDGSVYGNASTGQGAAQYGSLWKYVPGGKFKLLHVFNGSDGAYPGGALVQDSKGLLYGFAIGGGEFGRGAIFKMQPSGEKFTVIHSFAGDASGGNPHGLALGTDNLLYGVTSSGGNTGEGVAFKMARDGSGFQVLHSFDSTVESINPQASLVTNPADGYVYGTTNSNGADYGSVYRFNGAGNFQTVLKFDDITNGEFPTSPLVVGPNGHLYGSAPYGGPSRSYGTLIEIDPATSKLVGVVSLTDSAFAVQAGLTKGSDGMLYVPAYAGGANSAGAILKVDPAAFPAPILPKPAVQFYIDQINPPMTTSNTTPGKLMKLAWYSQYADSCAVTGTWDSGQVATEGTKTIRQTELGDYPYVLTCSNAQGSTSSTQVLHVLPKP